ncbi:MAG: RNA polymerase sigma factor [Acidobacteriaceae bacterium]
MFQRKTGSSYLRSVQPTGQRPGADLSAQERANFSIHAQFVTPSKAGGARTELEYPEAENASAEEDWCPVSTVDEPSDASDALANFLADPVSEDGVDGFPAEKPQLSPRDGVENGMGTIAWKSIPLQGPSPDRSSASRIAVQPSGDYGSLTDAEIMLRAGTGDDACFAFLAEKYRRPIISFMYRTVHNQAIAEELAQEVFLRIYRARASYRAEARFTTWLYRIASNMAINHARDTKSERASSSVYLDQPDAETGSLPDVADFRPLAEQQILRDERMHRIREQVMALPERQRMAVVMHKYQDMDYRQIAAVLQLSGSATKSLLFRAYQTLRERLKEFV